MEMVHKDFALRSVKRANKTLPNAPALFIYILDLLFQCKDNMPREETYINQSAFNQSAFSLLWLVGWEMYSDFLLVAISLWVIFIKVKCIYTEKKNSNNIQIQYGMCIEKLMLSKLDMKDCHTRISEH